MGKNFSLCRRNRYPWLFLGLMPVFVGAAYWLTQAIPAIEFSLQLVTAITGAVGGFVLFLYTQHHQNTQLFVSLFDKFNERYGALNEMLNAIVNRDENNPLRKDEIDVLYDYFNLCAEEYLYFKAGYIDQDVWRAWMRGMRFFAQHPQVRTCWEKELKGGSYYGFSLEILKD